jgi:hypothetical protein
MNQLKRPPITMFHRRWRYRLGGWVLWLSLVALLALTGCGGKKEKTTATAPDDHAATAVMGGTASQAPSGPVDAVKVFVDEPGLYRLTGKQLMEAGFDPSDQPMDLLSLQLAGEPVPFVAVGSGSQMDITFYGRPRQSRYGRENVYWLSWASDARLPTQVRAVSAGQEPAVTEFRDQIHLEESLHYNSQTPPETDHWLWEPIFAPASFPVTFDLPSWTGGDIVVDVVLWANTSAPEEPDHHILLEVNSQQVADVAWDGKGWQTLTARVPGEILEMTGNTLVVDAPGDTGAIVDVVYLDHVRIDYERRLSLDNGRLQYEAVAGDSVAMAGVEAKDPLLWDVTQPGKEQPLEGFVVTDGTLRLRDEGITGQRNYVVSYRENRLDPLRLQGVTGSDLRDNVNGADYVAIVHDGFEEALSPLLDWRRAQGLRVTVASIQEVYDTFSYGMPDPAAIRDYMRFARNYWPEPAPRYLLLVGDASYDYLSFLPGATPNYVPTYLLETHFVGETASDNWFVSLDDDNDKPDMAVGRIPAQTADQVATVVAKTLAYEQDTGGAEWSSRALFVADDKQPSFQMISEDLARDYLPADYQVTKVYLGQSTEPGGEVLDSLRQGVGLVTYVGHGSMNVWAQEKILHTEDITGLDNGSALPFLMTMTCLVGYFHHPQATSMGEELLFKQGGGVVAALVPTSESLASDQRDLAVGIYTHLFDDEITVGEAIMRGKQELSLERDLMQDLIETFTLLGDPALKLQRPQGN